MHLEIRRLEEEQLEAQRLHEYVKAHNISTGLYNISKVDNLTTLYVIQTWDFLLNVLFMDTIGYLPPRMSLLMINVDENDPMNTRISENYSSSSGIQSDRDNNKDVVPSVSTIIGRFVKLLLQRLSVKLIECDSTVKLASKLLWMADKFAHPMIYLLEGVRKLALNRIVSLQ